MPVVITPAGYPAFSFDAVTQESHESVAEPTEHPVELGVDVTDHVRLKADVYTVIGIVTLTPLTPDFEGPLALDVETYAPPPFQSLLTAVAAVMGPPPPPIITAGQFLVETDYVTNAHEYLLQVKTGRILCEVATTTVTYTDMILQKVACQRQEVGKAEFTLEFKQITTVTTATVAAPKPVIPAGLPKVNAGSQGTTQSPEELKNSALKSIVGLAGF